MTDTVQGQQFEEGKTTDSNSKRQGWLKNSKGVAAEDYESPLDLLLLTSMPPKTQSECVDHRVPIR